MALAETANLIVNLGLKGNFVRDMSKVNKSLDDLARGESRAFRAGAQIGTGIKNAGRVAAVGIAALTSQVVLGLDSLIKLEKATAQTEAVIESTGGAAGITATEVRRLAEKYEALNATIGDEVIQSGQNLLLTFTAINKEAFEPALQAALDLSVAMGTDLDTAIRTVGKALSEPEKAMARLRRQGIILTAAEEKQVKAHLKNNDTLAAQNVILAALDKRYGGSFLAGGNTTAAKVAKFGDAIEDLQRSLATAMLPAVSNIADALTELLADPEIIKGTEDLGKEIGKMFSKENIKAGADALRGAFQFAKDAAPVVAEAARVIGGVVGTAVRLFSSLPKELQGLLIGGLAVNKLTGGLVTNIAGGLISSVLKQLVSGVVNVQGGVVNVNGGIGTGAGGAGGWMGSAKAAAAVLGPAIAVALASDFVTNETNKQGGTNFANPFAGGIGGNIVSAITNLNETLKLWQRNPPVVDDRAHEGSGQRRTETTAAVDKVTTAVENLKGAAVPALGNVTDEVRANAAIVEAAQARTAGETQQTIIGSAAVTGALIGVGTATAQMQGTLTQSAVRTSASSSASRIVGAIQRNRPITYVNVRVSATTVNKTTTVHTSYGPGGGSGDQNSRYGPVPT